MIKLETHKIKNTYKQYEKAFKNILCKTDSP